MAAPCCGVEDLMVSEYILIFVAVGKETEAKAIARHLVKKGLAACTTILNQDSIYRWKGKIVEDTEYLLIIKTMQKRFEAVRDAVLALHSYEVPEVISIRILEGYAPYLNWLTESVSTE